MLQLVVLPAGSLEAEFPRYRPATSWVNYTISCNTQSSAPEDGRNYRPKHLELIEIINKLLLLHLVGFLYYLYPVTLFEEGVHKLSFGHPSLIYSE